MTTDNQQLADTKGKEVDEAAPAIQSRFRTAEVFVPTEAKLYTVPVTGNGRPPIPEALRQRWQHSLSLLIDTLGVSTGVVMRIKDSGLEVMLCGGETAAEYNPGSFFPFGTGSYCETAIGLNTFVAMDTPPDSILANGVTVPLRRYFGIPLHWDDGSFYGTLCLFSREDTPADTIAPLLAEFASSLEKDLALLCLHQGCDEQNERYARAMEAVLQYSPGGIFSYSAEADEQFSYISENMLAFLGYTQKEFSRKFDNRFSQMVYEEDRERTLREIDEQIRRGPFDRVKYRIEKKDGSLVWVHDEGHIVKDLTGKKWFYVVIVDISESVKTQQLERDKYRASMQALLSANPDAVATIQLNMTQNLCGEGHGTSDTTNEFIKEKTVEDFFAAVSRRIPDPNMRHTYLEVFNRQSLLRDFAAGTTSKSHAFIRENDGVLVWIRTNLNMLKNPDTGDIEGVAYSVDISREKRRDEILRIITSQEYDLIALVHLDKNTLEAYFLGAALPHAYRELLSAPGSVYDLNRFRTNAMENWMDTANRETYRKCSDPAYYLPLMDANGRFEFVLRELFPDVADGEMYRKFQFYALENDRNTILVIESDVTSLYKKQQLELDKARAETERVVDIMDYITSGISVLHMPDPDHLSINYLNQQMYQLLGFPIGQVAATGLETSPDPIIRKYKADAFTGVHPDDLARVKKAFHDHFDSEYFSIDNYRSLGANGKYCWIKEEVRLRAITPEYKIFYATYHDVSEEVRLNEELKKQLETEKQLRQEAITANATKTDFLSRMSHDIRTPLNGIIGMTYLTQEMSLPKAAQDNLQKIATSSQFLLNLVNDILDMSKVERQEITFHPEPYPFEVFCAYLDAVIRPLCAEKRQEFRFEAAPIKDYTPIVDIMKLNQIYFNLLSNAMKYTPEGGIISLKIQEELLADDHERFTLTISDNGIGMSQEFQKTMFEPFTQENRDDSSLSRGSGLGLAIVKRIVEAMNGTISVKSKMNEGSSFTVSIVSPCVRRSVLEKEKAANTQTSSVQDFSGLAGKHILLCEDHPLNQEIAKALLVGKGMLVQIAEDGQKGLEAFSESPLGYYDCVLMDIRMPVMDGYAATKAIRNLKRADAKDVPILAMTADAFSDDIQKCLDAGMNGHIAKPIDPQKMYSALQKHTAEKR